MATQKDNTKPRRPRLAQSAYKTAWTLRSLLADEKLTRLRRRDLVRRLKELKSALGVNDGDAEQAYKGICRALSDLADEAQRLRLAKKLDALDRAVECARKTRAAAPRAPEIFHCIVNNSVRNCGFIAGEIVEATRTADLRAGEIGCVTTSDGEVSVGRVVEVSAARVSLKSETRTYKYAREKIIFAGRVNPEPVGRTDGAATKDLDRLESLRRRLDGLTEITDESERFRVEREIYDLTHKSEAFDDVEEWPEYIGEGRSS